MTRVAVVIPAGGAGRRMGGACKPLLMLRDRPILAHTLQPFLERDDVVSIVIAVPPELLDAPPQWLRELQRVQLVAGGAERGDSVRNALAVVPDDADIVLVHDAARPLVSGDVIERCVHAAAAGRSVIAAVRVVDTIKDVDDGGRIEGTLDRRRLWAAQTPQAFPLAVLRDAYARALAERVSATDDAALVTRFGGTVTVVEGAPENIKITAPADLAMAEALIGQHVP
jgi:2-C-methyl-D-erythritol 4-phosphate cytidylyltransferase